MFHPSGYGTTDDLKESRTRRLFWAAYLIGVLSGIGLAVSYFLL